MEKVKGTTSASSSQTQTGDTQQKNTKKAQKCLAKGKVHHQKGRYDLALKEYRRAFELHSELSSNAAYHLNLGLVLYDAGNFEESLIPFQDSVRLNPDDPLVHCAIGNVYKKQQKFVAALEEYQTACEIVQESADLHKKSDIYAGRKALNGFVGCLVSLNRLDEALQATEAALEQVPGDFEVLSLKVFVLVKLKKEASAECELAVRKLLSEYFQSCDNNNELRIDREKQKLFGYAMSRCAHKRRKELNSSRSKFTIRTSADSEILVLWQYACSMDPSYSSLIHLGLEYERSGNYKCAKHAYLLAKKHSPEKWTSFYRLGKLGCKMKQFLYSLKRFKEALVIIDRNLERSQTDITKSQNISLRSQLQVSIGIALVNLQQYDKAKVHLQAALTKQNNNLGNKTSALALIAFILLRQGQPRAAFAPLLKARNIVLNSNEHIPRAAEIHYCTAIVARYLRSKETHEAVDSNQYSVDFEIECLQDALFHNPGHRNAKIELNKRLNSDETSSSDRIDDLPNAAAESILLSHDHNPVQTMETTNAGQPDLSERRSGKKPGFRQRLTRTNSTPLPNVHARDKVDTAAIRANFLHSLKQRRSAISGDEASGDEEASSSDLSDH